MTILLATRNKDKVKELNTLLKDMGYDIKSLDELDPDRSIPEVEETGQTLLENAMLKARTINEITGIPTIADDTGLEVDALDGAPGLYAARYAGENCTYEDNVNKLLTELVNIPSNKRSARFKTVAIYTDGKKEQWAEGSVEGIITKEPIGDKGFGYDPIFYIPSLKKTYAQLSETEKNTISHRGQATRKLLQMIYNELHPTKKSSSQSQYRGV